MQKEIKKMRSNAQICLWTAVGLVLATALFVWISKWHFTQSYETSRWMLIAGSLLAVLAVSMTILVVRRRTPQLRQEENIETKISGYTAHVGSLHRSMLAVITLLCILTILADQSALLMLAIVCTMMLFLAHPGMYKVKNDLGLTDAEMHTLYGDQYPCSDAE